MGISTFSFIDLPDCINESQKKTKLLLKFAGKRKLSVKNFVFGTENSANYLQDFFGIKVLKSGKTNHSQIWFGAARQNGGGEPEDDSAMEIGLRAH